MKEVFSQDNIYNECSILKSNKLICGWCNTVVSPNKGYNVLNQFMDSISGYIYICPNCNQIILYNESQKIIFPFCKYGKEIKKLPSSVGLLYEEIRDCYASGAFTAISLLGRKLLMHIGVQEGAEKDKNFVYYVDYINDKGFVPKKSKQLLDFLRQQGNEANHDVVIFKKEDAEKLISFIELILLFIYEYADE